ncbi:MAG: Asp-tRNA(Asn)/Glu-tRNA(Gln) amidotransferase subunit GatA, partial [Candidatus Magasanikbacteria bacterium]|nr:Asp-tRNA(Asn)/Glu-tRNA(Gln) amidotransferase subunit GatA [Candidatus Magasanikbacteria bacterium]
MTFANINKIKEVLTKKEISCQELISGFLNKIKLEDGKIHAFLEIFEQEAREKAKKVDEKIRKGEKLGELEGMPLALKDNLLYAGHFCSAGSKILRNYVAPYSATAVRQLEEAGSIFLGRTNMDEFAMGSSTENSAYGPTKNPRDLSRVPGGSSGGSAAAVAADFVPAALGSDTGGSIRQPAAFCGTIGLKPTYGAVSRFGLIAMSSSLDQIGPLAKSVSEAELIFNIIKGQDLKDATTKKIPDTKEEKINLKKIKIGIPKEYFGPGLEKEVETAIKKIILQLEEAGAEIKETSLPHTEYALPAYYLIMPAEVSSNLARFDGIRYGLSLREKNGNLEDIYFASRAAGFGAEVKRRIILGTFALSAGYFDAYYKKARETQEIIKQDFSRAFQKVDCLLTPTAPTAAFKLGEKIYDPLTMYLSDIFTVSVNLAGLPALSLPAGSARGLPV